MNQTNQARAYIEDLIKDECELNLLPKPQIEWEQEEKEWKLRVKLLDLYVVGTFSQEDFEHFPDAHDLETRHKIRTKVAEMIKEFNPKDA